MNPYLPVCYNMFSLMRFCFFGGNNNNGSGDKGSEGGGGGN
jgi:hypothetical protein